MIDKNGNLITNNKAIEEREIEVFTERLKPNEMEDHLKSPEETENKLCEIRLKLTKSRRLNQGLTRILKELSMISTIISLVMQLVTQTKF